MQMLNVQQQSRKPSFGGESMKNENNLHQIQREINDLRNQIERKADRKDIFELRNCVHKQISSKMCIKETERIVEKFEREVFEKFNENADKLKKIESLMRKNINEEFYKIRDELDQSLKSKEYKAIAGKIEKKLKKCI